MEEESEQSAAEYTTVKETYLNELLSPFSTGQGFQIFQHLPNVSTEMNDTHFSSENLGQIQLVQDPRPRIHADKACSWYGYTQGKDWKALAFLVQNTDYYFLLMLDDIGKFTIFKNSNTIRDKEKQPDEFIRGVVTYHDSFVPYWTTTQAGYNIKGLSMKVDDREDYYQAFVSGFNNLTSLLVYVADSLEREIGQKSDQIEFYRGSTKTLTEKLQS